MRILIAIVLSCALLTGCSDSGGDSGTEAVPTTTASPTAETLIGADMRPDDPSLPRVDVSGRTPDAVLLALIDARNSSDWQAAYSMYAAPEVDIATASREWTEASERYEDFTVREIRVIDPDTAVLRVTYKTQTTPPDGDPYPVVIEEPGEWWAVEKVDGLWKVKWMPRQ